MFKRHIDDCEFDIENFNFFAIERIKQQTVIENNLVACYHLDCSPEKHQDFVNRFCAKLKIKNQNERKNKTIT